MVTLNAVGASCPEYIATFYSHFGALTYYNALKEQGIDANLMPVPRSVSSSCGTCVHYKNSTYIELCDCELDGIYTTSSGTYECVCKNE